MSEQQPPEHDSDSHSPLERMSALFAQMILQQTNMAMMLLGKVAHPETGKTYKDIDAARMFIDQLEMLENKTKGNLSREESGLLKQSLMSLRLAFVEAVGSPQTHDAGDAKPAEPAPAQTGHPTEAAPPASAEDDHRKKFSKKY